MNNLKLYVWEGVLYDYTDGIAFALASSVKEAKNLLIKEGVPEHLWKGNLLQGVKAKVHKTKTAYHVFGGG